MSRYFWAVLIGILMAGFAASSPSALSRENSRSAVMKLDRISSASMEPGETITLSEDEINSFLQYDYASQMPEGVRDLKIRLLKDTGTAHAFVDLAKLQSSTEGSFTAFWLAVFRGERQLDATCRYTSADGQAIVEIESAALDGTSIPKPILDWLVSSVLSEHLSDFELGEPSPLPNNLKQIRVEPGRAVVISY